MATGQFGQGTWISERRIRAVARAEGLAIPAHLERRISEDGGAYAMNLRDDDIHAAVERTWGANLDAMDAMPARACG